MNKSEVAIVILAAGVVGLAFAGASRWLEWAQVIAGILLLVTAIREITRA